HAQARGGRPRAPGFKRVEERSLTGRAGQARLRGQVLDLVELQLVAEQLLQPLHGHVRVARAAAAGEAVRVDQVADVLARLTRLLRPVGLAVGALADPAVAVEVQPVGDRGLAARV